jgi:hypothetical protein
MGEVYSARGTKLTRDVAGHRAGGPSWLLTMRLNALVQLDERKTGSSRTAVWPELLLLRPPGRRAR